MTEKEKRFYDILEEFYIPPDFELLEGYAPNAIASLIGEVARLRTIEKETEGARPSLEREHKCFFRDVKNKWGKVFGMCSCGALLCKEDTLSQEDIDNMREQMRAPGAVFVEVEDGA